MSKEKQKKIKYYANMIVGSGHTQYINDLEFSSKSEAIKYIKDSAYGNRLSVHDDAYVRVSDTNGRAVYIATMQAGSKRWHPWSAIDIERENLINGK